MRCVGTVLELLEIAVKIEGGSGRKRGRMSQMNNGAERMY